MAFKYMRAGAGVPVSRPPGQVSGTSCPARVDLHDHVQHLAAQAAHVAHQLIQVAAQDAWQLPLELHHTTYFSSASVVTLVGTENGESGICVMYSH